MFVCVYKLYVYISALYICRNENVYIEKQSRIHNYEEKYTITFQTLSNIYY